MRVSQTGRGNLPQILHATGSCLSAFGVSFSANCVPSILRNQGPISTRHSQPWASLAHANCTPLLEEKDLKNDRLKNYFFWTFATHMTQIPPKKYNFTQFAAFFHFLFFKINYYFV